jgi:hypothetical protein
MGSHEPDRIIWRNGNVAIQKPSILGQYALRSIASRIKANHCTHGLRIGSNIARFTWVIDRMIVDHEP